MIYKIDPNEDLIKVNVVTFFIKIIILFQIFTNIFVIYDIPYARQIFGFIYLTFIPGLVFLLVFKLWHGDYLETLLMSIGLDIALLLFIGLLVNELLPIFNFNYPLSTEPLLIVLNIFVIASCLLITKIDDKNILKFSIPSINIKPLVFIMVIPALSILGDLVVNNDGTNKLLLLMLALIALFMLVSIINKKFLSNNLYALAIFAITFALIFHTSLITNYLIGWDYHSEYQVFKLVDNKAFWDYTFTSSDVNIAKGYSMLSVTILPTIYSKIAAIDGTTIFRVFYSLLLSLVPLCLYKFYSERMKDKISLLAIFFLISNQTFFGIEGFSATQIVGEFFYALIFLIILKNNITPSKKLLIFIFFSTALVISYYSLSYILLFFLFIPYYIFSELSAFKTLRKYVTLEMLLLFFTITFTMYIYSNSSIQMLNLMTILEQISLNFGKDFFDIATRSATVLSGLGLSQASSPLHLVGRIFFYVAEFFILIGFAKILLFNKNDEDFQIDREYTILALSNLVILIMCIVIPNFARFFRAERFYQLSLLFLAPFFVYGGSIFFKFFLRRKNILLTMNFILIVLIPLFLFETGFFYEMTGDSSYSLPLSMYRMDKVSLYYRITNKKEINAAVWLSDNMNRSHSLVYGDLTSTLHVLTSYGMLNGENYRELTNTTKFASNINYVYLREVNTEENIITTQHGSWSLSDISPLMEGHSTIYSNGPNKIYFLVR